MAAKDKKKKKVSGVAKLVKAFLKRESSPKSPAKAKIQKPTKKSGRKLNKLTKPKIAPISAAPRFSKQEIAPSKSPEPRKNGKLSKHVETYTSNEVPQSRKPVLAGPKYFFKSDIPDSYNETYMRAIPRDPQWVFAFWEISDETRRDLRSNIGESGFASAKRIVRLLDVTDIAYNGSNAERYVDIEINEFANNWYIQVPESGRSYVVELGMLTTTGRFFCAVRSNVVTMPNIGVSQLQDEEWATVSTDELIRMSADAMRTGLGSSERRFAAAETLVGHAGFLGGLASGSGSGGLGDFSSGSRY